MGEVGNLPGQRGKGGKFPPQNFGQTASCQKKKKKNLFHLLPQSLPDILSLSHSAPSLQARRREPQLTVALSSPIEFRCAAIVSVSAAVDAAALFNLRRREPPPTVRSHRAVADL